MASNTDRLLLFAGAGIVLLLAASLILYLGFGLVKAATTNTVAGTIVVPGTCYTSISNTAIGFAVSGSTGVPPGSESTVNTVTDTDANGNVKANVLTSVSGSWTGAGVNTFGASNTLWSNTLTASLQVGETTSLVDTYIVVLAGNSNSIYYMVNVPFGQNADTYTQTINIENSC